MTRNVCNTGRGFRVALGLVLAVTALTGLLPTVGAIVCGVLAVVALGTGAIGFCPLYTALGVKSCQVRNA